VAEYRRLLEQVRPAPNVVLLVGHNTLRGGVVGYDARPATPDELARMARALEEALADGARGFSTGLIYAPGRFAEHAEILALAAVAARRGGLYTSHMRSEGRGLLEAINEALAVGRASGVRIEISHLKTAGRESWPLVEPALERIESARREGLVVAADRYPYTASNTDLDVVLPAWAAAGGRDAVLQRLRDPAQRQRLRDELERARPADYWTTVTIASCPSHPAVQGTPLVEAAAALGRSPVEAVLHLLDADELRTTAFFHGMCEANLWRILAVPWVMLGTDASLRAPEGPLSRDYPHPRAYGTMPRFLRAALDGRTVPLPEAVRKLTSLPAGHFGLAGRGVIAPGQAADLVVFDPATLEDRATYAAPHQLAGGIERVIVNGVVTLANGRLTGDRGGTVL
jgi:N-acyl-D-aspartate/D-glutamate deacylase